MSGSAIRLTYQLGAAQVCERWLQLDLLGVLTQLQS
jgi:hypothetical protein